MPKMKKKLVGYCCFLKKSENRMTVKHRYFTITMGLHWCIYWNKLWSPCVIWFHIYFAEVQMEVQNTPILVFKQPLYSISVGHLDFCDTTKCFFHLFNFLSVLIERGRCKLWITSAEMSLSKVLELLFSWVYQVAPL